MKRLMLETFEEKTTQVIFTGREEILDYDVI